MKPDETHRGLNRARVHAATSDEERKMDFEPEDCDASDDPLLLDLDQDWRRSIDFPDLKDSWEDLNRREHAALNAILSRISLQLTSRVKSRDASVQVNARRDAWVQCSLGPRTLRRRDVRCPPTLAVYSPMAYRNVASYLVGDGRERLECAWDADAREDGEARGDQNQSQHQQQQQQEPEQEQEEAWRKKTKNSSRVDFQFLEQKYGCYHCKDCNLRWESAYVWCIAGTNKVYFKQYCRKCQKGLNPYSVEDIKCSAWKKHRCLCQQSQRHVDLKRPHRQDLCGRCKDRRLSCDSTFSFKYIV
ncbi:unnamed protein product [Ophioblennius macclurei]